MSNILNIKHIFSDKNTRFSCQCDYRWRVKTLETLLLDIENSLDTHYYLGEVVFSKTDNTTFEVIDGQQRLISVVLLLRLLLNQLSHTESDYRLRIESELSFHAKIDFGRGSDFITELFTNSPVEAYRHSEERLAEAYH